MPGKPHPLNPTSVLAVGAAIQAAPNLPPIPDKELQLIQQTYGEKCHLLKSAAATPSGFFESHPEQYSLIHFSTHAIANSHSPLSIPTSFFRPEPARGYKLYAHDLDQLHLKADLVTLSACQSAGAKNVPGEGLVGLTWAVLSTGSHNVVASLWEVGADATAKLMTRFYTHLHAGESPDRALHSAKLEIASGPHAIPFDWAAFQIYSR